MRRNLNQQVTALADEINAYAREIAGLNLQIKQVELNGERANDLRDRRDLLLDKLSEVASIQYSESQTGEVSVYLGSHELVFGTTARTIVAGPDPADTTMTKLTWQVDGFDVRVVQRRQAQGRPRCARPGPARPHAQARRLRHPGHHQRRQHHPPPGLRPR
ncbi:hypothetical protein O0235_09410 [Tepidiforma flava]|uniref:Flagellar hook-associated protein 1 n=1 Tax=Tepidiforma flava TaxID=3004094 RepID=A0ABY7M2Y1_9CHLR|nr:hypothetical protein [Tepidiforma flava]WBL35004.1 hypothetical protein O0235_09410 [Tepidiforma flava]